MISTKSIIFILLLLVIGIYATETVTENTDAVEKVKKHHTKKTLYYTLRKDYRKCASCGGWFLKQVNSGDSKEIYVMALDYDKHTTTINDTNSDQYVVGGTLKKDQFHVSDITRCLPAIAKKDSKLRYYVYHNEKKKDYIVELNTGKKEKVSGVIEQFSTNVSHIHKEWLEAKVKTDSILLGAIGKKKFLEASSVFIRLPDPKKPCKALPLPKCTAGHVPAFSRQVDRCLKFEGCVAEGICTLSIPVCDTNYSLVSFNSKPNGCPKYYCDPSFLVN
ncbi:hypothetical protein CYY_000877 [Polysphondylium violaceum]|uniref:Chitin-binding type-2 domain-containing protein n=1 Tax=Polysphondylium violaceum TaxID=133409 RepID=A0A8J4Q419_9MYCE|nr:hypothetical protein CYY_000877 [Polysphondylium violaceum]